MEQGLDDVLGLAVKVFGDDGHLAVRAGAVAFRTPPEGGEVSEHFHLPAVSGLGEDHDRRHVFVHRPNLGPHPGERVDEIDAHPLIHVSLLAPGG